jgi:16S rRNA G1207 methylase RsmC
MVASRRLDAKQESLEREVKRLINRKKAVPELADAERLTGLALQVESELQNIAGVFSALGTSWGQQT